ncbi:ATP-dependent helicase HrpB [Saccharibacter sp. 17.LH.SD]|uniref:ATP-dependent helicase HrpB n=1 Tax=Saccharibacter sp. 17.LH.SD TaxID=2689393 RepID=UPI00136F2478|nr:ATP-dependent helicase HrpB [Saccharibacter sp. 17.LH.SD]MXV44974.1 ATP-dependent helicase HrpB [Saccharibacter sp. 17.LH.SD]
MPSLPVSEVLPRLHQTLDQGSNGVLVAPPGAGKTTTVPLALLEHQPAWLREKRLILVEPRRVAVRAAAARMASLLGEKPGETVGYRTRVDSAVSAKTRIEVVTEGLLVRRLLSDPLLEGVGAVLFDEVHERSLDGDTALGFALDVQRNFRNDLRLLVMSATLEGDIFTKRLQAPLIESKGRQYPVEIRYRRDIAQLRDLPEVCAQAIRSLWEEEEGSILAFLPGVGEIRRTQAALGERFPVFPLYGEQSVEGQSLALDPRSGRRVVLATSIAETSVTVPGVKIVIDGGWRRLPQRDPSTGISKLQSRRISRATAEQRAGRAGREAPGIAVRLWSEMTQRSLIVQEVPAIREVDLCDFALSAAAWREVMGTSPDDLPLIEAPPSGTFAAGQELLKQLGAIDQVGALTSLGRRMVGLGTHPRLAAMLCAARTPQESVTAACLAALLEERDPFRSGGEKASANVDIRQRLILFAQEDARVPRGVTRLLRQSAKRFLRRVGVAVSGELLPEMDCVGTLIVAGFPDRVAQLTNGEGRYRLAGGGSARVPVSDLLAREKLLASAAFHVKRGADITLAAPVNVETFPPSVAAQLTEQREGSFDGHSGRVIVRQRLRLGALVLRDRNELATPEEAIPALRAKVHSDVRRYLEWSDAANQFQARVALARAHYAPHLPDLSDEALAQSLEWLEPWLSGLDRLAHLKALDVVEMLRACLDYQDVQELNRQLPAYVMLKAGKQAIDYTGTIPAVSARAQAFYGTVSLPLLANGKVPLHAVLLSPAGRPQAVTADLARFWQHGWHDMRRDMRGRYPRHAWPDDPSQVDPPSRKER